MEDYSMKAKTFFVETMNRCDALLALYDSTPNDDLLRFAVILAASALDHYVSYSLVEKFADHVKGKKIGKKDMQFFNGIGLQSQDVMNLMKEGRHPFRSISNALRRHLGKKSMQSFGEIEKWFQYYGISKIVDHACQKSGRKTIRTGLKKMLDRRNDIAHACDYNAFHKLQSIDKNTVANWLTRLTQFVYAMDEILDSKFGNIR